MRTSQTRLLGLHFVSPSVYMHLADSFPFGSAQGFGSQAPLAGCAGTFHGKLVFPHPAIKLAFFLFDSHLADSLARSLSAPLVFSSPPGRSEEHTSELQSPV